VTRFIFAAVCATSRASSTLCASGFSQKACRPAFSAVSVMMAWVWSGVATMTASSPPASISLRKSG
jgi:hypothetical protein